MDTTTQTNTEQQPVIGQKRIKLIVLIAVAALIIVGVAGFFIYSDVHANRAYDLT